MSDTECNGHIWWQYLCLQYASVYIQCHWGTDPLSPRPFLKKYLFHLSLFIWLLRVLAVTCKIFNLRFNMWDLVLWPGIELRPPTRGAQGLSHWTTREVPLTHHPWGNELIRHQEATTCLQGYINNTNQRCRDSVYRNRKWQGLSQIRKCTLWVKTLKY